MARPERANWREIVPEQKESIDAARMLKDRLVVSYLKDAASAVKVFGLDGRLVKEVALPGIGQAFFLPGRPADPEMFFLFSSYTAPRATYRLDAASATATAIRQQQVELRSGAVRDRARILSEQGRHADPDGAGPSQRS